MGQAASAAAGLRPGQIDLGPCPSCPSSLWAKETWKATNAALDADWKARVAARSAAQHRQVAAVAAAQAAEASQEIHRLAAGATLNGDRRLRSAKRFCSELDHYVKSHPSLPSDRNLWPRIQQQRGVCSGLETYADIALRAGSLEAANRELADLASHAEATPTTGPASRRRNSADMASNAAAVAEAVATPSPLRAFL
eukprot:TRINITY_DN75082_c0_g1_i1.p1 TRINITY_DN75082_c0_g1~~TRINITY_DN75082_c0_g1_i1.p1  ORF type:complete len:197 (-),score=38.69 TRINITY_DN75082_c0_g1_i1:56-646(-)